MFGGNGREKTHGVQDYMLVYLHVPASAAKTKRSELQYL